MSKKEEPSLWGPHYDTYYDNVGYHYYSYYHDQLLNSLVRLMIISRRTSHEIKRLAYISCTVS